MKEITTAIPISVISLVNQCLTALLDGESIENKIALEFTLEISLHSALVDHTGCVYKLSFRIFLWSVTLNSFHDHPK
jgi:hypothetical protein